MPVIEIIHLSNLIFWFIKLRNIISNYYKQALLIFIIKLKVLKKLASTLILLIVINKIYNLLSIIIVVIIHKISIVIIAK